MCFKKKKKKITPGAVLEVLWTKSETRETHEPLKLNKDDDALNDGDTRREQTLKSELVGLTHRLEERYERG